MIRNVPLLTISSKSIGVDGSAALLTEGVEVEGPALTIWLDSAIAGKIRIKHLIALLDTEVKGKANNIALLATIHIHL